MSSSLYYAINSCKDAHSKLNIWWKNASPEIDENLPFSWIRSRRRARWTSAFYSAYQCAISGTAIGPGRKFTIGTGRQPAAGKTVSRRHGATWFSHSWSSLLTGRRGSQSHSRRTVDPLHVLPGISAFFPSAPESASPNACLRIFREITRTCWGFFAKYQTDFPVHESASAWDLAEKFFLKKNREM